MVLFFLHLGSWHRCNLAIMDQAGDRLGHKACMQMSGTTGVDFPGKGDRTATQLRALGPCWTPHLFCPPPTPASEEGMVGTPCQEPWTSAVEEGPLKMCHPGFVKCMAFSPSRTHHHHALQEPALPLPLVMKVLGVHGGSDQWTLLRGAGSSKEGSRLKEA